MPEINKHRGWLLRIFVYLLIFCASANAFEYFFAGKNYLSKKAGIVSIYHQYYFERGGRRINNSRSVSGSFSKTIIRLKNLNTTFRSVDRISFGTSTDVKNDSFIDVKEGDTITIYTRNWYQSLYSLALGSNIYCVKKNGETVYQNIAKWKSHAFGFMIIYGVLSFILWGIYLSYAKDITISQWFQKRFSNKPKEGVK
jgi:hypothetical protein